ncbi:hypothetical protein K2173_001786 [Erythroxylum novogranatense]|uniref:X8 domain-containing protein n=1 Tax=Erythroxylum novogranatense TaxID=1862640 RepID=A0AAV8SIK9_9ROSI|nr:hypothetical protein K2173_001786 [Erythroxylum novogranatense]
MSSPHLLLLLLLLVAFSFPQCPIAQKSIAQRDLWCVAKNNADDQSLQQAIDWACGPGGANCDPIQQNGPCYDPNDVQTTASWAFNDYYLKNGLTDDACYFSNTAALTNLNPSHDKCKFPSSSSVNNANGNSTITIGTRSDSADLSSCNQIAGTWVLPLINSCLLFLLTWGWASSGSS